MPRPGRQAGAAASTSAAQPCATASSSSAIVTTEEVREHLRGREVGGRAVINDGIAAALAAYYARYGARR